MGLRGAQGKTTQEKIMRGNPGKQKLNTEEPLPDRDQIKMPVWIDDKAKQHWDKHIPQFETLGYFTNFDCQAFAVYCQALSDVERLTNEIRKEGDVVTYTNSYGHEANKKNEKHALKKEAIDLVLKLSGHFGLTPTSRSQIKAFNAKEGKTIKDFMNKKKKEQNENTQSTNEKRSNSPSKNSRQQTGSKDSNSK